MADALRAFAVICIIVFHGTEHFSIFTYNQPYTLPSDGIISEILSFFVAGKAYGLFAILFGLSFFIMRDNQEQKGKDFSLRFFWRMILLFVFGIVNAAFYDGDILMVYAIFGVLLIPVGYISTTLLWAVTIIILMQPMEIFMLLSGWNMDGIPYWDPTGMITDAHMNGSFWTNVKIDTTQALVSNLGFFMHCGRFTQTIGFFFLGLLLDRKRFFYDEGNNRKAWWWLFFISGLLSLFAWADGKFFTASIFSMLQGPWWVIIDMYKNLSITLMLVSAFTLLWYYVPIFKRIVHHICFFGRMSLTNYLFQSIFGTLIFYHYGLGLYSKLGVTWSFLISVGMVTVQCIILYFWSKRFKLGPFETIWRYATWGKK